MKIFHTRKLYITFWIARFLMIRNRHWFIWFWIILKKKIFQIIRFEKKNHFKNFKNISKLIKLLEHQVLLINIFLVILKSWNSVESAKTNLKSYKVSAIFRIYPNCKSSSDSKSSTINMFWAILKSWDLVEFTKTIFIEISTFWKLWQIF